MSTQKADEVRKDVADVDLVERCEVGSDDMPEVEKSTTMGTVTINDSQDLYLVPSPSADPRGTLDIAVNRWTSELIFDLRPA